MVKHTQIVRVCFTILWGWRLKGYDKKRYSIRRDVNSDFSIVTTRRVAIIIFELRVVKISCRKFDCMTLDDYLFV